MTGEAAGSTAKIFVAGNFSLSTCATPTHNQAQRTHQTHGGRNIPLFDLQTDTWQDCGVPVMCPPVPTPVMTASTPLGKSAKISWAVVRACTSMLAGLLNWQTAIGRGGSQYMRRGGFRGEI